MQADVLETWSRKLRKAQPMTGCDPRSVAWGRDEIFRLLPHRDPFLFVDGITAIGPRSIEGHLRIDPALPLFAGHFPDAPIFPGVLQLEAMGQLGICLLALQRSRQDTPAQVEAPPAVRALRVHHASFLAPVLPGDDLVLRACVIEEDDYLATCAGQIIKGGSVLSLGVMEVYFVET